MITPETKAMLIQKGKEYLAKVKAKHAPKLMAGPTISKPTNTIDGLPSNLPRGQKSQTNIEFERQRARERARNSGSRGGDCGCAHKKAPPNERGELPSLDM